MGYPLQAEDHPEDAKLPRHQISRAFIPPCIHPGAAAAAAWLDCLSRTSRPLGAGRNPRRTLLVSCVQVICRGRRAARCVRNCMRNQDLRVLPWLAGHAPSLSKVGSNCPKMESDPGEFLQQLQVGSHSTGRADARQDLAFQMQELPRVLHFLLTRRGRGARRKCNPPARAGAP